jgi:NAD(P)-dependent dehydrogenase (short-subunit alcohol dehydrogenase family)
MFGRKKSLWVPGGKVIVIVGGTRGLGLELGRQLSKAGAALAICGKDPLRLAMAESELRGPGAEVFAQQCDVTDSVQVSSFAADVLERFGRVDAVVNCAGVLTVGPALALTEQDYAESIDVMYLGPMRVNLAVLPAMLQRGEGRIVNVSSLGGEVGFPRMSAYSAAKAALHAYSRALAIELAPRGIAVTTVVPSFMRTGAHVNGRFKGRHHVEYNWFSLSSSLPLMSVSAEWAAGVIIEAMCRGHREVLVGPVAHAGVFFMRHAQALTDTALRGMHRLMPGSGSRDSETRLGFESTTALSESALTKLGRDAAKVYRQYGPTSGDGRLTVGPWNSHEATDREEAA